MKRPARLYKGLKTTADLSTKRTIIPVALPILEWIEANHDRLGVCKARLFNDLVASAIKSNDIRFKGLE